MKNSISQEERENFLRIAEARLRKVYMFPPQRRAVAAKMFVRWAEKKSH
jgi:hypothetical protein